jgi:hypothetical protein
MNLSRALPSVVVPVVVVVVVVVVGSGCGAAAGPGYTGEPLLTVQGVVENPDNLALPPGASAQIVWRAAAGSGDAAQLLASTTVETTLPADFAITLYTTPPSVAVVRDNRADAAVAYGAIVVVNEDQLDAMAAGRPVRGVFGKNDGVRLAYVPSSGDASDLSLAFDARPAFGAGFNIVSDNGETVARADDLVTLTLVDGGQP